jgi:ABC-type transport system involved in multi-copper enzyme maturation permease subunit
MTMLWHKAWLETRWRFIAGLLLLTVMSGATVYEYVVTQRMMPLAESALSEAGNSPLGAALRDALAVQREFRGFIWYNTFRDNLTTMGVLFAVLLGCGGLMAEAKKGSALFTLSLPVTRRQLLGARVGAGLAQCFVLAMIPPLVIPLLAPAIGQQFSVVDALAHGLCLFIVGALFFSLASFLSTLFGDIWRPLMIAVFIACVAAVAQFAAPELGLFKVMSGESYFRNGTLPWMGFVTTAVLTSALLYGAAETLERRDF